MANTKVYDENGKTVFANWIVTDPWDVSVSRYRYKLPFKSKSDYKLYVQKQSGRSELDYMLRLVDNGRNILQCSVDLERQADKLIYRSDMAKDVNFSLTYE